MRSCLLTRILTLRACSRNGSSPRVTVRPNTARLPPRGPDHARVFEVEVLVNGEVFGRGSGHSKQAAAKQAASAALEKARLSA